MARVHDVVAYILKKKGRMTAMKMQKLAYYCQAWSLVWDERPLFASRIEAWANGPVIPELYKRHRGEYWIVDWDGDPSALSRKERETVDAVLKFYGDKTSHWLSILTHRERPWLDARQGLDPSERSGAEITLASMAEYYGGLAVST